MVKLGWEPHAASTPSRATQVRSMVAKDGGIPRAPRRGWVWKSSVRPGTASMAPSGAGGEGGYRAELAGQLGVVTVAPHAVEDAGRLAGVAAGQVDLRQQRGGGGSPRRVAAEALQHRGGFDGTIVAPELDRQLVLVVG